jgi:hypothetical protein
MNTSVLSKFEQPRAYIWQEEDLDDFDNLTPAELAAYETRIQIAALNKRVDQLTQELNAMQNKQQQKDIRKFLRD